MGCWVEQFSAEDSRQSCKLKSTTLLATLSSIYSTHIQVSAVQDTVLNDTDVVPTLMKLRLR